MRSYKLKVELPFLRKGTVFYFDDETACVYTTLKKPPPDTITNGDYTAYPLRSGLSGYLWLLLTEGNKYFKKMKER